MPTEVVLSINNIFPVTGNMLRPWIFKDHLFFCWIPPEGAEGTHYAIFYHLDLFSGRLYWKVDPSFTPTVLHNSTTPFHVSVRVQGISKSYGSLLLHLRRQSICLQHSWLSWKDSPHFGIGDWHIVRQKPLAFFRCRCLFCLAASAVGFLLCPFDRSGHWKPAVLGLFSRKAVGWAGTFTCGLATQYTA